MLSKKKSKLITKYKKQTLIMSLIVGLLIIIIAFISVMSWGIYKLNWQGDFVYRVVSVLPYPAARIDKQYISYKNYLKSFQTAAVFYQRQADNGVETIPTEAEMKEFVMDRLIENVLVKRIAKQYNITVSDLEIADKINEIVKNQGSEQALVDFLKQYYDLSIPEYEQIFTEPDLYYAKTAQAVVEDENLNKAGLDKMNEALDELNAGRSFAEVAGEFSAGETASQGGLIGEFYRGELPNQLEDRLYAMEFGQYTDIVSLPGSLQIIKLEKKDMDNGILTLSAVILPITTLEDLLTEQKNNANIKIYAY